MEAKSKPDFSKIEKMFNPDIFWPVYLNRKALLHGIAKYTGNLSGKLMDFGCGSKPYRSLFNVDEYVGVDFHGEGHSHENEQIDVFYDGKKLPFENETFDSVFTSEVFEHVFNLEEMLPEINRVMKPGAKMLITCPFIIGEHEQPNDYARYTSFGIKHLLEKNGFRVLEYEKLGDAYTTVTQVTLSYIHVDLLTIFNKIPYLNRVLKFFIYPALNIKAIVLRKILPRFDDMYLNNLVYCEKINTKQQ